MDVDPERVLYLGLEDGEPSPRWVSVFVRFTPEQAEAVDRMARKLGLVRSKRSGVLRYCVAYALRNDAKLASVIEEIGTELFAPVEPDKTSKTQLEKIAIRRRQIMRKQWGCKLMGRPPKRVIKPNPEKWADPTGQTPDPGSDK